MGKTEDVLKEAITGEFNAIRKYRKYAEIALSEQYPGVAKLFEFLVLAETSHLENHKRALDDMFQPAEISFDVGTTVQNVESAIKLELWEAKEMYPAFIKGMKKENSKEKTKIAILSMTWALEAEQTHAEILMIARSFLNQKQDFDIGKCWLCKVCGQIFTEENYQEVCKICGHDSKFYYHNDGGIGNAKSV